MIGMRVPADQQQYAIGRTQGLVVFGTGSDARGLLLTINARPVEQSEGSQARLSWLGSVTFQASARNHLASVVLSVVDRVAELLGLTRSDYQLSCANPGAASTFDLGASITGFSADVPILLAMLSAALQIPLMDGLASTGHVASTEGDIAQVRGLPEKIEAALVSGAVLNLIVPAVEGDASVRALTPREYDRAKSGIRQAQSDIEVAQVSDIEGLLRAAFSEEMLALGSLSSGYYFTEVQVSDSGSPVLRAAAYLRKDNPGRLWRSVEAGLLARDYERAKALLAAYANHHLRIQKYPPGFGERLWSLVVSVPPRRRKDQGFFPLLPMPVCVGLSNLAGEANYQDVRLLYRASFGEDLTGAEPRAVAKEALPGVQEEKQTAAPPASPLEVLLARISPQAIAEEVGLPLDEARARYQMDTVVVKDAEQFNQHLVSFYAHILRHTHEAVGTLDPVALLGEVLDILERAFAQEGGYRGAVAEATDGTRGGLRFIYDRLTEQLKREAVERYVHLVFTETIDPLDWEAKVALMSELLVRIGSALPAEVREQPPQRYAAEYETIIRYYVDSLDRVAQRLKAL